MSQKALNHVLRLPDYRSRREFSNGVMYVTRASICVELWTLQVSYRILVPSLWLGTGTLRPYDLLPHKWFPTLLRRPCHCVLTVVPQTNLMQQYRRIGLPWMETENAKVQQMENVKKRKMAKTKIIKHLSNIYHFRRFQAKRTSPSN